MSSLALLKRCIHCQEEQPVSNFGPARAAKDGLLSFCRTCACKKSKAWRDRNRGHVAAYERQRREADPEYWRAYSKRWRAEHHDELIERWRAYRAKHPGQSTEQSRRWCAAHPGRRTAYMREYTRQYYIEHRAEFLVRAARRKARQRAAEGTFSAEDVRAMDIAQSGLCAYCQRPYEEFHVEHRQPLILGGTNWPDNLCLSCPRCNLRKGSKTEAAFRAYLLKYGI